MSNVESQQGRWWTVRMIVEVKSADQPPTFDRCEDRIVLVRATDEREAYAKGEIFAAQYERESSWRVLKVVDAHEVLETELSDGVELYSAFINHDSAEVLMKPASSPIVEWQRQNPSRNPDDATVGEVIEAWDRKED